MADLESALTTLIGATATITALIGAAPVRCYPLIKPQGAVLPTIAYQRISTPDRFTTHQGQSGLAIARMQLTVWASSYGSGKAVSDALRRALVGFRGTVGGVRIDAILPEGETDDYSPDTKEYMRYIDYHITHQET